MTPRPHVGIRDLHSPLDVLFPVLDNDKHYGVGEEELEKHLVHGAGLLATHHEREQITQFVEHASNTVGSACFSVFFTVDEESDLVQIRADPMSGSSITVITPAAQTDALA